MSWVNIASFPTEEAPVLSSVDGRLPFISINDDLVQTQASSQGQEIPRTRGQTACLEATLIRGKETVNSNLENSLRTKQRKLTSKVWKEFTKYAGKDGEVWAICNHCNKKFDGSSKNGTTHLNNHLERCGSRRKEDGNGKTLVYDNGDEPHLNHGQEITEIRGHNVHFEAGLNLNSNASGKADDSVENSVGTMRRKLTSKVLEEFIDKVENGKERKEKFGERIVALQQLISPYGKTDPASVLFDAMEYIQFLHKLVKVLGASYLQSTPTAMVQELEQYRLRSRGLCLVPIFCTAGVAGSNGADSFLDTRMQFLMPGVNIASFPTEEAPVLSSVDGRLPFISTNDDLVQTQASSQGQEIPRTRGQTACLESTLIHGKETVNSNLENSLRTKRRKLTSKVWKEFTKYAGKDGKVWAMCKHCNKKFDGSSKNGTTHLNNHLERCGSRRKEDGNGETLVYDNGDEPHSNHGQEITEIRGHNVHFEPGSNLDSNASGKADDSVENSVGTMRGKLTSKVLEEFIDKAENGKEWAQIVINQHQMNRLNVTRTIIMHGFWTLNSIKADIFHVYREEKEKLCRFIHKFSCRFSITVQWFEEYYLMVLYFTDDSWKLKRKTLSFHHGVEGYFSSIVQNLLWDWKIDKNICSIVTDIDHDNKDGRVNSWLSKQASLFGWQLLSIDWLVRFLQSTTWLKTNWASKKMSKCFDYVRNSSNKQKFLLAVDRANPMGEKMMSTNVPLGVFSFEDLETAVGFKEVFCQLEQTDPEFTPINLTIEEWDKATTTYKCLKVLNEVARSLSESKYTTANVYFPKVCDIHAKLLLWEMSGNDHECEIALLARKKFFDRFWSNSELVLATAVIFDPRFKMDIVERWYTEIYSIHADRHLKNIIDEVTNIYSKYVNASNKMLDEMGRPCTSPPNYELELYLKEPKIPSVEEFDILDWWHSKIPVFPILAKMARDLYAVPISPTAISDFPLKSNEIENIICCTGLDDDIKPALVCSKSWLESSEDN